jgi:hypothetical protein
MGGRFTVLLAFATPGVPAGGGSSVAPGAAFLQRKINLWYY